MHALKPGIITGSRGACQEENLVHLSCHHEPHCFVCKNNIACNSGNDTAASGETGAGGTGVAVVADRNAAADRGQGVQFADVGGVAA